MNLSFQLSSRYMLLYRLRCARWPYQRGLLGSKHTISFGRNPKPSIQPALLPSGAYSRFSTCMALRSDTRDEKNANEKDVDMDMDVNGDGDWNEKGSRNQVQVRYFEQATRQSKARTEVKSLDQENDEEEGRVRSQIRKLRQELHSVRQGPFAPHSPFMQSLPEREKNVIQEIIHKYELEHPESVESQRDDEKRLDDAIETFFSDTTGEHNRAQEEVFEPAKPKKQRAGKEPPNASSPAAKSPVEVELKVSDVHTAYVSQLNKSLRRISNNPMSPHAEEAWRWYRRCRESILSFPTFVSSKTYDLLWESQVRNINIDDTQRFAHCLLLADDILAAGEELSQSQWLEYIGLLSNDPKSLERSLALWRDREAVFDFTNLEDASMYWKLGVHLLVATGRLQEAHDIALSFLRVTTQETDPRILIPLINALSKSDEVDCSSKAWVLYLKLKNLLKSQITMEDYDMISNGFLEGGKTAMGMAVFKDMMLTGQASHFDSTALYASSTGPTNDDADTEFRINQVSLEALTILPRKFQNKFFYASWMKKLIGMGKVDSAAAVAELMFERGIRPDAKHLNGLIAGWLRQGDSNGRRKAEKLGWAMVQQRVEEWQCHVGKHDKQKKILTANVDEIELPRHLERKAPAATIETFSILILHYIRRGDENMGNYLIESLANAGLKPNSFIINHLMYAELRKQHVAGAWIRYEEMTAAIRPDLETFACLWDCAKIQNDRSRALSSPDFPSVRVLYREMMDWFSSAPLHQQKVAREQFSKDLYDQIFRCFSYAFDTRATIVALFSLRETFGLVPDDDTIRILMFQILRLVSHKGRIKPSSSRTKQNLDAVTRLLDILRERREIELAKRGLMVQDLDLQSQSNLNVNILGDLLRVFLNRQTKSVDATEDGIRCAAEEMGLPDIDVGERIPEAL